MLFSRLILSQHGRLQVVSFECFTRYTNPQLVAKCEQILCVASCEFEERATKPKFVAQVDPLSTILNNKLIAQGEKLKTSTKLRVFVLNISLLAIYEVRVFVFRISPPLEHSATYSFFCRTC